MDIAVGLHGVYLFATVFGGGITAVDMLGLLGHHGADGGHGSHDSHSHHGDATQAGAHSGWHVLLMLRYLPTLVYFALGFGPLGLAAEATGAGILGSLASAVPGGLVAAWLAQAFWRWQQRDVDSSVREHELLLERARVLVPLSSTAMGKVRLRVGPMLVERYALAEDEWEAFRTNDVVEIVRVTDECVYVRRAEGPLSLDAPL